MQGRTVGSNLLAMTDEATYRIRVNPERTAAVW
jgi:hypothetical protein